MRDRFGRQAIRKLPKDAANDVGLNLDDCPFTGDQLTIRSQAADHRIAIAVASTRMACFDASAQTTARLRSKVFEKNWFIVPFRPTCGIVKLRDISKAGTWAYDQTQAICCLFRPPLPT
jgi:hypothetical protein